MSCRKAPEVLLGFDDTSGVMDPEISHGVRRLPPFFRQGVIAPFVENSRAVASSDGGDGGLVTAWRMASAKLLEAVAAATAIFDENQQVPSVSPSTFFLKQSISSKIFSQL